MLWITYRDRNQSDVQNGDTALLSAIKRRKFGTAQLLLELGAEPTIAYNVKIAH